MTRVARSAAPAAKGPSDRTVCAHCGLEVPPVLRRSDRDEQFCCAGCEQVYGLLHDWGCADYYRIRASLDEPGRQARRTGRAFEDFDDPSFAREYVESTDRGTLRTRLYLEGVHCAACVWLVEQLPEVVDGLVASRLSFASAVVEVEWNPARTSLSAVARALDSIGYSPHAHRSGQAELIRRNEDRALVIKLGVAAACAMNIMFLQGALYAGEFQGMERSFEHFFRWIGLGLALPVMLFSARPFFRSALAALRQRVPHMDLPIALALTIAFGFSVRATVLGTGPVYFDSLSALVALLLGSRVLQRRAHRAALEQANSLRSVAFVEFARLLHPPSALEPSAETPKTAGRPADRTGTAVALGVPSPLPRISREVPLTALRPGDHVEIRSGELVPVDGTVISGASRIDNAALTGESAPVAVGVTDRVHAGTTNLGGRLVVEVEAAGADTRVGALLALVEDAMAKRVPLVETADRISRVFVLVVLALAVVTGLLWARSSWELALEQTVALLVVTCPCALGLATPVAVAVGLARAARAGIFIKNPAVLERLRDVGVVLLDKTGTLTCGQPTVDRWSGSPHAVDLAHALESESSHPVADALRRSQGQSVCVVRKLAHVRELAGLGLTGQVDGRAVAVGNRQLVRNLEATLPADLRTHAATLLASGHSPLYVVVDAEVAAVGAVGDHIRPDARATIAALQRRGIEARVLSGDHPDVVARVAAELGIAPELAHGGLSPEAKRDCVSKLTSARPGAVAAHRSVVMVGDGVNDAAAMALADVGIAVQGGAGASIVAADVVLTRAGLAPLLEVVTGSRRLLGVVYRNLAFSLVYNVIGASLAIAGLVGPLVAALLMPASSLTVVLSSVLARPFPVGRALRRAPTQPRARPTAQGVS